MKKIQILLLMFLMIGTIYAQKPYDGLHCLEWISIAYNDAVKPYYEDFLEQAKMAEAKGQSLSSIINEFNEKFGEYTHPLSLRHNATSKTIESFQATLWDGFIESRIEYEKNKVDKMKDKKFSQTTTEYLDEKGVKRVDKIIANVYKPWLEDLKIKIEKSKANREVLDYIIIESNIWFDRLTGYAMSKGASVKEINGFLELAEASLRLDLLRLEKKRMQLLQD